MLPLDELRRLRKAMLRLGKGIASKGRSVTAQELRDMDAKLAPSMQGTRHVIQRSSNAHLEEA